jgi:hypothetical protein
MNDLITLETMLKNNDWTYEMSDDSSAYTKGKNHDINCRKVAKEIGTDGVSLYNQYYLKYAYPKDDLLK